MSTYQTNVPSVEITDEGIDIPQTTEILNGVLKDFNTAFGGNLNLTTVSTPQYVLSSEMTQAIALAYANLAFVLSQFDPDKAIGRYQDALARIYFITRKQGTPTVVECLCTGIPGSVLPAGSLARDDDDNIYESLSSATFDKNGQATVSFANQVNGAIACPAESLTHIQVEVAGWDAITNTKAGVTGSDVEGRNAFETRRQEIIALNATSTVNAIRSAVFDIEDVVDVFAYDNPTGETMTYGATDYELKPHSVYVAVVGGDDESVAKAIWTKKDIGCDMNGNTTVTVYDEDATVYPYPEYSITFERPASTNIYFYVEIQKNVRLEANIIELIRDAIVSAFNGEDDNFARPRIADSIYASDYYSVVSKVSSQLNILLILIGTEDATETVLNMGIDQMPVIDSENIEVVLK